MSLADRIDALLPLVSKPTRYLGNEFHAIRKTPVPGMVKWCLILPEVYEIGMSHWGLKILYHVLNRRPDTLAERAFAPWFDMEARMRRHEIPLFSLESRRPLREFDLVGFSLQYELTYTNLLNCLDLAGIPLRAEDRGDGDPLIIAGGPCASNPEPLSDFIDLFLIGDGEEAVEAITERVAALRGRPRSEVLREMARVPGLYVPLMYEARYAGSAAAGSGSGDCFLGLRPRFDDVPARVQRQFVSELENAPWPERPIVPIQGVVQDRLAVEVLRGCTQGCRFCQAGYLYRPVRERSAAKVLEIADRGIRESGWDELGLVSLSTADHTQLGPMADILNARFARDRVALSLPSLRADAFGIAIAERVRETRKTGFTFAPEAGSERLRLAMNKNIPDGQFFESARIAYERGWRLIKIYFMIGLPTETHDDIQGIVRFVDQIRRIGRTFGPSCSVNASVGAFVPKSHTPFQWDAFEGLPSLREKLDELRSAVTTRWSRLKWNDLRSSHLEAVFSMGDRRVGRAIERAFRAGARFDGWTEHMKYDLWLESFAAEGIDPDAVTRKRSFEDALPWDHIDIGVLKKWLIRERKKTDLGAITVEGADGVGPDGEGGAQGAAHDRITTPDCRHGQCAACGMPGMPDDTRLAPALGDEELAALIRAAQAAAPPAAPATGVTWPVRIVFEKAGRARFVSHLEMGEAFARAFRMARVALAFSQGHKPHPKLSFGPPLPVGIDGLREILEAELLEPWTAQMRDAMNEVLPDGLRILDARPLPVVSGVRRLSVQAEAKRARYAIVLAPLPDGVRARIAAQLQAFAEAAEWVVERSYWNPEAAPDKPVRMVDLKQAVIGIGGTDGSLHLELYLEHSSGHVANPRIILEKLFLLEPEEQALLVPVRLTLLDEAGREVS